MSRTLNLIHAGWESIQRLAQSGRKREVLSQIAILVSRSDLPPALAAAAHRLAAELEMEREGYAKARNHLRSAVRLDPGRAHDYHLIGLAHELDPDGCDRKASGCYRKASELEPHNARYRAAFGRAAVRTERVALGVRELLAASEQSPADAAVLRIAIDGLIEAKKLGDAERVLVKARFLCPGSGEIRRLWDRVRFEAARATQRFASSTQEAGRPRDGGAQLLPFLGVVGAAARAAPARPVRRDVLTLTRPHLARLRSTNADR